VPESLRQSRQVESLDAQTDASASHWRPLTSRWPPMSSLPRPGSVRARPNRGDRQIIAAEEKALAILRDQFGWASPCASMSRLRKLPSRRLKRCYPRCKRTRADARSASCLVGNLPNQEVPRLRTDALQLRRSCRELPARSSNNGPMSESPKRNCTPPTHRSGRGRRDAAAILDHRTLGGNADKFPGCSAGGSFWTIVGGVPNLFEGVRCCTQARCGRGLKQAAANIKAR